MGFLNLEDKVAIVTGHRSGIGQAIAAVLAEEGARVTGFDLPELDLTDTARMRARVAEVEAAEGRIDILVNNAGITALGSILDTPAETFDAVMAVNLRAPFLLIQAVLPGMVTRRRGAVVNIASDQAFIGKRFSAAYGASKAAIAQLTKSAALDWAPYNIRFNAVAPGSTDTAMLHRVVGELQQRYPDQFPTSSSDAYRSAVPLGRIAEPREIGRLVAFLASDAASFMTGAVVPIDGGETAR